MQHTPYDYSTRIDVLPISWEEFGKLTRQLVEGLSPFGIDMVVGVARGGFFPATAVACALDLDMTPVRLTRRERGLVVRERPVWKVDVASDVSGRTVAVVDEIASTGETITLVAQRVLEQGAARVITASLAAHTWAAPMPEVVVLVSDALIIFPWDREVYSSSAWSMHPEYVGALRAQGLTE